MENDSKKTMQLIYKGGSSVESEMDEMAHEIKGTRGVNYEEKKWSPIYSKKDPKKLIGHRYYGTPFFFVGETGEIHEFVAEHREFIDELKESIGVERIRFVQDKLTKDKPRKKSLIGKALPDSGLDDMELDTTQKPTGNKQSVAERMRRKFYSIVVDEFQNNETVVTNFRKNTLASLKIRRRENLDRHNGKATPTELYYATHGLKTHKDHHEFLEKAIKNAKGVGMADEEIEHIARQYNKKYSNWDDDKKLDVVDDPNFEPKTPVYKLNTTGLEKDNLNVQVMTHLIIRGRFIGDVFRWELALKDYISKKSIEDGNAQKKDTYRLDNTIVQPVEGLNREDFNDDYTIMDNIDIVNALHEALNRLAEVVSQLNPKESLRIAMAKEFEITKAPKLAPERNAPEGLNEAVVNRIMQKLMKG
jgi:hypothetical protein